MDGSRRSIRRLIGREVPRGTQKRGFLRLATGAQSETTEGREIVAMPSSSSRSSRCSGLHHRSSRGRGGGEKERFTVPLPLPLPLPYQVGPYDY
jgi:hypothetical protein